MFVVAGATGNAGNVVARNLLAKGEKVRVIGRDLERLKALVADGAEAFQADLTDTFALARAFAGAKAVYLLIPPNVSSPDFRGFQNRVTQAIASALQSARVSHAVTLSSIGADKPDNNGPVAGLHEFEERLNRLVDLNVLHLRAAYFMENTFPQVGNIEKFSMAIGALDPDLKLAMIAAQDVGAAAADALLNLNFRHKQTRELLGERDLTMREVTQIIGNAIDKPGLPYVQAEDDQLRAALIRTGMSLNMADLVLEMAGALNSGHMRPLETRSPENTTPTSYERFVEEQVVPLFEGSAAA
ncbi:MAG: NAD(P)H-binding protein [Acidobacteria bacterium]|nr:NAD(P)H-binding protein [Acidobacteriota bacterium]